MELMGKVRLEASDDAADDVRKRLQRGSSDVGGFGKVLDVVAEQQMLVPGATDVGDRVGFECAGTVDAAGGYRRKQLLRLEQGGVLLGDAGEDDVAQVGEQRLQRLLAREP